MEIMTESLSRNQILSEIDAISEFLVSHRIDSITIMYGYGCNIREPYQPIGINTADLRHFIEDSINRGMLDLGNDDFYIENTEQDVEFTLCHESDIHFKSMSPENLRQVRQHWQEQGYPVLEVIEKSK